MISHQLISAVSLWKSNFYFKNQNHTNQFSSKKKKMAAFKTNWFNLKRLFIRNKND